jgi:uncharacterized protein YjbI with pentapeptide repeats
VSDTPPLPPHQQLVALRKWPFVGESCADPDRRNEPWRITVSGLVVHQQTWSLEELHALPQVDTQIDIHCVTRWSKLGASFGGVPLQTLLDICQPLSQARFVSFVARSARRHSTSLPLAEALQLETLLALAYEGQPLAEEHGGPIRTIVRDRYFYKSLKWLEEIRLLAEDELGYWEKEAGYHNEADPWQEQRYIVPHIDNMLYRRLLKERDFSGQDLLGIRADGRNLTGLNARRALLRDAHFERSQLDGACFDGANLSNAHFEGASLRNASFRSDDGQAADLEGADFRGADLRGADLTGASLFGATFCPEGKDGSEEWGPAWLDSTTQIEPRALERLTPLQHAFVNRALHTP